MRTGRFRLRNSQRVLPPTLGVVIALAILGPLFGQGWPLLLDFVWGPAARLPESAWGLGSGITATLPLTIVSLAVNKLFGATGGWLLIALIFPLCTTGMARLVKGPLSMQLAAGALYALNPVVFERLWAGQIGYLLGYALLPFFVASILSRDSTLTARSLAAPVLWMTAMVGCSVHFIWIGGVVLAAHVLTRRPSVRAVVWALSFLVLFCLASAYLLPSSQPSPSIADLTTADLSAYATKPQAHLGVTGTVAALYGFWRVELVLPKQVNPVWWILLAVIVLVAASGLWRAWNDAPRRHVVAALLLCGATGLMLAGGADGVVGSWYTWAFNNVPAFDVMREAQKFVVLVALLYAYGFGVGVSAVFSSGKDLNALAGRRQIAAIATGAIIVIAYTPTMFWAFGGRMQASDFPPSWRQARAVMPEDATLLFLPWHQYISFSFTDRRVANPAAAYFPQRVISGDNVELPGIVGSASDRSAYIETLLATPSIENFGQLMAPVGVDYIAVAHEADWTTYQWLGKQRDLTVVYDDPTFTLYKNERAQGDGYAVTVPTSVTDISDFLARASTEDIWAAATDNGAEKTSALLGDTTVKRTSPTSFSVETQKNGFVILPEPFHTSWKANGRSGRELISGTSAFPTSGGTTNIEYHGWSQTRRAYVISVSTLFTLIAACIVQQLRTTRQMMLRRREVA